MVAYLNNNDLLAFLEPLLAKGSQRIVSIVYQSEQKCLVKSRVTKEPTPDCFKKVYKFSCATVAVNADYETLVNAQRAREGADTDFEAESHAWADHVEGKPYLLQHKKDASKLYLQIFPTMVRALYTDANLKVLSPAEVKAWFEHYGPVKPDPNGGWQDLDKPIKCINPALDNVLFIKSGKNEFGDIEDKKFVLSLIAENN